MSKELHELAAKLIQCGNGPDSNERVQQLIASVFPTGLIEEDAFIEANSRHQLLFLGTGPKTLVFVGHSDVVSTGDERLWQHPPFSGEISGGRLFGRGSVDMRAAVAAFALAARDTAAEIATRLRVVLFTAGDEETTCKGAPAAVQRLNERGESLDVCLVGEPSAVAKTGDRIRIGRRGSLSGVIRFSGEQAHVAYVPSESNVVHTAAKAAVALSELKWPRDPAPWPAVSFHVTNIQAGTGESNVVPGALELRCNIRFGPSLDREAVIARCEQTIAQFTSRYSSTWSGGSLPYFTSAAEFPDTVVQALKRIHGVEASRAVDGGTSDGRFFARAGIPTVELGTPAQGLHEVNESLALDDLDLLYSSYCEVLREYASGITSR